MTLARRVRSALALLLLRGGEWGFLLAARSACAQPFEPQRASSRELDSGTGSPGSASRLRGAERLTSAAEHSRYIDIATLIHRNLHLGPHFTMAVDAGTIKSLRAMTSDRDVPILIAMLSDRDPIAASAAQDLLVVFGMKAVEALLTIRRTDPYAASGAASALHSIGDCYSVALWDRRNPDLCPIDRAAHRGEEVPTELPP